LMVPPETSDTRQPWWLQIAVKHLNWPDCGWVTTTCWSPNTSPLPTWMSVVLVRAVPPPPPPEPPEPPEPPVAPPVGPPVDVADGSEAVCGSLVPHAASRGRLTPAAARPPRARREILSVVMTAGSSKSWGRTGG